MYKQIIIYTNTTSISKPEGYMNYFMGLGSSPLITLSCIFNTLSK